MASFWPLSNIRTSEENVEENEASQESNAPSALEEDDPTALLRYLKNQGKLSQNKALDEDNQPNRKSNMNDGAADDENQQLEENKSKEKSANEVEKTQEDEDRESLLKYMSQRGVVLRPAVAVAVPVEGDEAPGEAMTVVEGRFQLGVGADNVSTADLLREAFEELNEAAAPLKYVLGEEEGRNLREEICADIKKFIRDHRPGIRLIARAAQRFFTIETELRIEEEKKKRKEKAILQERMNIENAKKKNEEMRKIKAAKSAAKLKKKKELREKGPNLVDQAENSPLTIRTGGGGGSGGGGGGDSGGDIKELAVNNLDQEEENRINQNKDPLSPLSNQTSPSNTQPTTTPMKNVNSQLPSEEEENETSSDEEYENAPFGANSVLSQLVGGS